jgi:VWFA-related protein
MSRVLRAVAFLLCISCLPLHGFFQLQTHTDAEDAAGSRITLDVVVTDKSGKTIKGLEEKNFTVLADGHPQRIVSFQAVGMGDSARNAESAQIVLLIDEVNTGFNRVAYERDEIKRFLLQNGGTMVHPTKLAFFSDSGIEIQENSFRDGNALLAAFEQHETALRSVRRSEGFYGALERFQFSMKALQSVVDKEEKQPGRKVVLWISPGWPILSGQNIELDNKQAKAIFASIVSISTALRLARITIYSVDPLGVADAASINSTYYEEFLKPVTNAKKAQIGDLALQVLATQTGGLALRASNDIASQLNLCVGDLENYYTLTIDAVPADQPNSFHPLSVKIGSAGLTARTRNGYYATP